MTPQKQLFRHNPPETYGDCYRTVIACILDLKPEEVPHYNEHNIPEGETQSSMMNTWLLSYHNLQEISFEYPEKEIKAFHASMEDVYPDTHYLLSGISANGVRHVVICKSGEIVWDPALDNSGIVSGDKGVYGIGLLVRS